MGGCLSVASRSGRIGRCRALDRARQFGLTNNSEKGLRDGSGFLEADMGRRCRFRSYRPWLVRCGLGRYCVNLHRRGAAPQLLQAKVFEREALKIRELLQRVAGDEELALEVSRRMFEA